MSVACKNIFLVYVTTEGYELKKETVEKILNKKLRRCISLSVDEYVPPKPKMKIYPEK